MESNAYESDADNRKNKAVRQVLEQVNHVILGKSEEIKEIMTVFLADGHVLLEDIPGVGKTTLAVAFSKAMQLDLPPGTVYP